MPDSPDKYIIDLPFLSDFQLSSGDQLVVVQSGNTYRTNAGSVANFRNNPTGTVLNSQTGNFVTIGDNRTLNFSRVNMSGQSTTGTSNFIGAINQTGNFNLTGNLYVNGTGFFKKLIVGDTGSHLFEASFANILGGERNAATGSYSTVINGTRNTGANVHATILNGADNTTSGSFGLIAGSGNKISSGKHNVILNGSVNFITPTDVAGEYVTILNGTRNFAASQYAFIGNGEDNALSGFSTYGTIINGVLNSSSGAWTLIGNGNFNRINQNAYSTILNGVSNKSVGDHTCVLGGGGVEITGRDSLAFGWDIGIEAGHPQTVYFSDRTPAKFKRTVQGSTAYFWFKSGVIVTGNGPLHVGSNLYIRGTGHFTSGLFAPLLASPTTTTAGLLAYDTALNIMTCGNGTRRAPFVTTGANLGTGAGLFTGIVGDSLQLNSIIGGTGIRVEFQGNHIRINAFAQTGSGSATRGIGGDRAVQFVRNGLLTGVNSLLYETEPNVLRLNGDFNISGVITDKQQNAPGIYQLLGSNFDATQMEWKSISSDGNSITVTNTANSILINTKHGKTEGTATLQTTDNTLTNILSLPASGDALNPRTMMLEVTIVGNAPASQTIGAGYRLFATFKKGAAITQLNTTQDLATLEQSSSTLFDAKLSTDGSSIYVKVQGLAATTVNWVCSYSMTTA